MVASNSFLVDCTFTIKGSRAHLEGQYPFAKVREWTSFYVPGFQYSPAFRAKKWDGRKHLFSKVTKTLPAGLVSMVVAELKKYNKRSKIRVIDQREDSIPAIGSHGFDLSGIQFGEGRYDYQLAAAKAMVAAKRGVLKAATNSGKTEISCAVTKHLSVPTIFLVERLELLHQARKRFSKRLELPLEDIGIVGDSLCSIGEWITVATPSSLKSRLDKGEVDPARWQLLFADECHHAAAETFYEIMDKIPAYYRFGMSGTPLDRTDGADLRLVAQTGEVIYEVSNKLLVERGISVQPHVEIIKIDKPILPQKLAWNVVNKKGVVENEHLNIRVVEQVQKWTSQGKQVLVLVDAVKHGDIIDKMIWTTNSRITHQFINGKEDTDTRQQVLDQFSEGTMQCIIATSILDEGVDVPCIDVLILAAGGKSKIKLLQRAGRGLRSGEGKTGLLIIDFANFTHKYLLKHSLERLQTYKNEDCFVIRQASQS